MCRDDTSKAVTQRADTIHEGSDIMRYNVLRMKRQTPSHHDPGTTTRSISIMLMDIDGVLGIAERFSTRYARIHQVDPTILSRFFDTVFSGCLIGEKDLLQELEQVLHDWKWSGTARELLDYWFAHDLVFDHHLLQTLSNIRSIGIKVYCASNQERYRAHYLVHRTPLCSYIDGYFFSSHIGVAKPHADFYTHILSELQIPDPSQILYWDDDMENIVTARSLGMRSHFYEGVSHFRVVMERYFPPTVRMTLDRNPVS